MKTPTFDAKAKRLRLGLNQTKFWSPIGVSQSTASRYESSSREIPAAVSALLVLRYGTEKQKSKVLESIQKP